MPKVISNLIITFLSTKYQLEIAVFNCTAAIEAAAAGADRIELCHNQPEGGTTPSPGTIWQVRQKLTIPIFAMLRPRGGDFIYNSNELAVMKKDLEAIKNGGCYGIVFGFLQLDGTVDKKLTSRFVEMAYPLDATFNRAFDCTPNAGEALEAIIDCGCQRILTSGQHTTAPEGAAIIQQIVTQANNRIIIMPGAGIRQQTITAVQKATGAVEFHSSALKIISTQSTYTNAKVTGMENFYGVDASEIRAMKEQLAKL